jgi:hypothetical protein
MLYVVKYGTFPHSSFLVLVEAPDSKTAIRNILESRKDQGILIIPDLVFWVSTASPPTDGSGVYSFDGYEELFINNRTNLEKVEYRK